MSSKIMNGLQITAVAAAAGVAGTLIGAGVWGGSLGQEVENHERRLTHHDVRIERLESTINEMAADLRVIKHVLLTRDAPAAP